ncbi:hypothetical protein EHI8A_169690 [Entamoeba histolytica HM-1:IMSS-B]|uniref:Uncharacterized protein n=4 Tax=Entamoeba histolytica TaxID=5759 RepID=C4M1K3_ENTH1|nr:hypothetical protein EHI_084720 [Entamoeba histolytica HM-1:IMSS]EAL49701.1 hypothetical protein EHI_084720 [Entamoeba histolytica HM-1:IMSS]EMH76996.1 hypothetical protein EHI8A_169690 [Entamoeba histolytica HM-1:IMSS-B]ENY63522.1 hypothetical protein EHI7A_151300 [Entamoeba histolytica HM-1:IMSS-A]GAT95099.1 hypothetical protein CL6EHI_084720 [Entamoeba histolytica]|eukprot:XP_655088.1 hypothetical protein EHI_084720 [Entamoeba histolytica HM-1:IMSS]
MSNQYIVDLNSRHPPPSLNFAHLLQVQQQSTCRIKMQQPQHHKTTSSSQFNQPIKTIRRPLPPLPTQESKTRSTETYSSEVDNLDSIPVTKYTESYNQKQVETQEETLKQIEILYKEKKRLETENERLKQEQEQLKEVKDKKKKDNKKEKKKSVKIKESPIISTTHSKVVESYHNCIQCQPINRKTKSTSCIPLQPSRNQKRVKEQEMKRDDILFFDKLKEELKESANKMNKIDSLIKEQAIHCVVHRLRAVEQMLVLLKTRRLNGNILNDCKVIIEDGWQNYIIMSEESTMYLGRAMMVVYEKCINNKEIMEEYFKCLQGTIISEEEIMLCEMCINNEGLKCVRNNGIKEYEESKKKINYLEELNQTCGGNWDVNLNRGVFGWGRKVMKKEKIKGYIGEWKEMELVLTNDLMIITYQKQIEYISLYVDYNITEYNIDDDVYQIEDKEQGIYYIKDIELKGLKEDINSYLRITDDVYQFPATPNDIFN